LILYLDTSAMIKLYIQEAGSELIKEAIDTNRIIATAGIAYSEAISAFVRLTLLNSISKKDYEICKSSIKRDWASFFIIDVSENIIQLAADLIEKHKIRSFDGIHLASAVLLNKQINKRVTFSSWDKKLLKSAQKEELQILSIATA